MIRSEKPDAAGESCWSGAPLDFATMRPSSDQIWHDSWRS
jgi:hypothetical protein